MTLETRTAAQQRCGFECDCPTRLHHDVVNLLAYFDAPIPRQSASHYMHELSAALDADRERDEEG